MSNLVSDIVTVSYYEDRTHEPIDQLQAKEFSGSGARPRGHTRNPGLALLLLPDLYLGDLHLSRRRATTRGMQPLASILIAKGGSVDVEADFSDALADDDAVGYPHL